MGRVRARKVPPLASETLPTRSQIQLLARVQTRDASGQARECFANIGEIGPGRVCLESGKALEVGSHVMVQVVFPGQRGYAQPQVPLNCIVRRASDEAMLSYELEITVLDKESHERLSKYLRRERRTDGT